MLQAAIQGQASFSPEFIPHDLVTEYSPPPGGYDEMVGPEGFVRPAWRGALGAIRDLGLSGLQARQEEIARSLRESGVSYNFYQGARRSEREWDLDVLPALCDAEEWNALGQGLAQRVRLYRAILDDLYGPRRLLSERVIPAELIHASPAYLLPCVATPPLPNASNPVILHAIDLARSEDGRFIVLGDRTQSPSGLGYAIKNRAAISRALPHLFDSSNVAPLTAFARSLQEALRDSSPRKLENPRVVLLTPGPGNETYFEQAFLARTLGLTLVEGRDLTVRSGSVWLKTIEGLQRIDVILRRQDDEFCDPLELRPDSALGTAGLVEAARLGNVALCNPLGSGILENPGLHAFLPSISRFFFGEELTLPMVAAWWCGQERELGHVLENLESLVLKPISRGLGERTWIGPSLSAREREELRARIRVTPENWVGEEILKLSTVPRLFDGGLAARRMVLRTFGFDFGGGQRIMSGGLLRTSPSADGLSVSNQRGGGSKDFWVVAPNAPASAETAPPLHRTISPPIEEEAPSRVAENLFWFGRYVERTGALVRLVRETVSQLLDLEGRRRREVFPDMLRLLVAQSGLSPGEGAHLEHDPFGAKECVGAIAAGANDPGSIGYNLRRTRGAAQKLADRLPDEAWRIMIDFETEPPAATPKEWGLHTIERMQGLIMSLAALEGLCRQTLPLGPSSDFFELGQRIERGLQTGFLLQNALFNPESGEFRSRAEAKAHILAIAESLAAYRRVYREDAGWEGVIQLLVFSQSNPRSIGCQMRRLCELVARLPGPPSEARDCAEASARRGAELVRGHVPLDEEFDDGAGGEVQERLAGAVSALASLSDAIGHAHFSLTEIPRWP